MVWLKRSRLGDGLPAIQYFLVLPSVPDTRTGLLMLSLCKDINALYEGAGAGGQGNTRGARAVDFKQGT